MKYKLEDYLNNNPFQDIDRDLDVKNHSWKIVKVRKEHDCMIAWLVGKENHKIKRGENAMIEKAFVEGKPESNYSCLSCMDEFLDSVFEFQSE